MTLIEDLYELEAYNYFWSAFDSETNCNSESFSSLGFMVPFRRPIIRKHAPDFLLIKDQYSLILECKSGYIYDDYIGRAKDYRSLEPYEIQGYCEEAGGWQGSNCPEINTVDVAYQFYSHIIEEEEKKNPKALKKLIEQVPIVICDKEKGVYTLYPKNKIQLNNRETNQALVNGITIPITPEPKETFKETTCDELIAHAIVTIILRNRGRFPELAVSASQLKDTEFKRYTNPTTEKIRIILEDLRKLKMCRKSMRTDEDEFGPIKSKLAPIDAIYIFDDVGKIVTELISPLMKGTTLKQMLKGEKK